MKQPQYEDAYVQSLFDRMGRTYDVVNLVSSFGFSVWWRWRCVADLSSLEGSHVCDMMSGSGECWTFILRRGASTITSIDFSSHMVRRQNERRASFPCRIEVKRENAVSTSLPSGSMDGVVGAFGLKTLDAEATIKFAAEIYRILRPGGQFSLIEISVPKGWMIARPYRWYLNAIIPRIGNLCLGDIECYRMLGAYTEAFGSCEFILPAFLSAGLEAAVKRHFFGCATSLVGRRPF